MALSPEEKEMLSNIKALVSQIESMEGGAAGGGEGAPTGAPPEEGMATMAEEDLFEENPDELGTEPEEGEEDEDEEEEVKMKKSKLRKAEGDEGSTATDDADERIDDQPEINQDNIADVVKALLKAGYFKMKPVQKSRHSTLAYALRDLTKVIKGIHANQKQQEMALTAILEGLGVADAIRKQEIVEKSESRRPVGNPDKDKMAVIMEVAKALQGIRSSEEAKPEKQDVRKSLGNALQYLVGQTPESDKK